ncbi:MAG TPA: helix-turn-helix domain-containing protein [Caulobacteraceae bacterium]|nr:helix-turn-helix domain-containing protein [Caulobacteraceae bacterium]
MSEEVYTVESVAEQLRLHPKTVLRFIKEGRLRATKVGKSYRILRSDLDALAGRKPAPAAPDVRVTSIVDVTNVSAETARKLAGRLTAVRMGPEAHDDPMSIDVAHDPARGSVKVVLVGSAADMAAMLRLIDAWTEA